jgi:hypothetical protein
MTQFIELTNFSTSTPVNIGKIVEIVHDGIYLDGGIFFSAAESPAEILAKIEEARKSDPLERIAVALEKIASAWGA